jgi:hypothetical protein
MPTNQSTDRLVTEDLKLHPGENKSLALQTLETLQFLGGGRRAMGTITFSGQPNDGEIITIGDGVNAATVFEFDDDDSVVAGRVQVAIGADAEATLDNLLALINSTGDPTTADGQDTFRVNGTKEGTTIINLKNTKIGTAGNVTITENATNVAVTGMVFGTDVGQIDTEMQAEVIVTPGDIEIGSVNLLTQADDQIDPSAAYAEDVAYTAADWVTPAGAVRKNARALPGSAADGDYTPLQVTTNGDLRTRDDDLLTEVGAIADAAVEGDAAGTIHAQLRGINKNAGAVADAAVAADAAGSQSAKLRGINKRLGTIGDAADVDGSQAAQLRYIGENIGSIEETVQECDDKDDFAAVNDAQNLADATNHVTGNSAVEWDKTGGTHVNSGIDDTIASIDLMHFGAADYVMVNTYIPDLTDVASVLLRLGTDNANYTEWQWADSELVAAAWNTLIKPVGKINGVTGTGWDQAAVTYVAFIVVFDLAADTLNNMLVDRVSIVTAEAVSTERNVYTEDTPHTSGDEGNMPLAVRTDARTSRAGTDGDYAPLQLTANGDLRARDDDLLTETGAIADAAVEGDSQGSVQAKLRGANKVSGAVADVAVSGDTAGSHSAKLRGMNKRLGSNADAADVDGTQAGQLRYIGEQLDGTLTGTLDDGTTTVIRALVSPNDAQPLADYFDATEQLSPLYVADAALALDNEPIADVMAAFYDKHVADWGAVGAAADVDGVAHGQLRFIGEAVDGLEADLADLADTVKTDDAGFTPATDKVLMVGAEYDDTVPDAVDEGDAGALRMSANRNLYAQLRDAAGNERGANVTAANELNVLESNSAAIQAAVELMDDAVGTDGGAQITKGMAIGGNDGVNFQVLKVNADGELVCNLETADIQIGAVELKNAATDDRCLIGDANVARAATDHVLLAQLVDAAGTVNGVVLNAEIPAGTQNIGDVDVLTLPVGTAAMAASTPVTLATDDTQLGAVGAAADVDGNVHGQLRSIGEAVELIDDTVHADDDIYNALDKGVFALAVRNDSLGTTYATVDQSYNPIATTEKGAVHVALGNGVDRMAAVAADAALATDIDGGNGIHVLASMYARQDDDTVEPVKANASNQLEVEVVTAAPVTRAERNPTILTQAVAVPGTREAFGGSQQVVYFHVEARKVDGVNAGNVYIGTAAVDKDTSQQIVLAPGDKYEFTAPAGVSTDLDAWFVDADNAADGITGYYLSA